MLFSAARSIPSPARRLGAAVFVLCCSAGEIAAARPEWVQQSDAYAQELIQAQGPFQPLRMSFFGIPGFDDQVPDLGPGYGERFRRATAAARDRLAAARPGIEHPLVRQDLEIMIGAADRMIAASRIAEEHVLPYVDPGLTAFRAVSGLLSNRQDPATLANAVTRLRRLTGLAEGATPFVEQLRARYREARAADPARLRPVRTELEQELANRERYVAGLRALVEEHALADATPALDALERQLQEHAAWVRDEVLPEARTDFRLPPELYAQALRDVGLELPPEVLIERAQFAYAEIRNELQTVAALIARDRGWSEGDYRSVLRELKREQLGRDEILPYYRQVIGEVEAMIRREGIVTLPERPMQIRLASEAESAAQPAPHMNPPPLVNNTGEMGTFVLPLGNPESAGGAAEQYDDFTYRAAAWTLVAHEGRPGHELQFASLVERGVSIARFFFAFNSVNVEGWALYAEAELKPYEPLEGQLVALQLRLLRAARAFLDPMLHLGRISPERARELLIDEVVLSPAMARQEIDRYTFRDPGQATSYFYGYARLLALRTRVELALGDAFDRRAFNDFLLDQGLLPPDLLEQAVMTHFVPGVAETDAAH